MSEAQVREIADAASVVVDYDYLEMYQPWATKSQTGFFGWIM